MAEANRESFATLKQAILSAPESARVGVSHLHDFCPGMFAQSIFMPAGMAAIIRVHSTQHFFVVVKGSCTVIDSQGNKLFIEAPHLGVTMPGIERVLYIHEDCICTTFHPTDLTDPEDIGKQVLAASQDQLEKSP